MVKDKVYPINDIFIKDIPSMNSLLRALQLNRAIKQKFDISNSEVEILLYVSSKDEPSPLESIKTHVSYLTGESFSKIMSRLVRNGLIVKDFDDSIGSVTYEISAAAMSILKSITL